MKTDEIPISQDLWAKSVEEAEDIVKEVVRRQPLLPFHKNEVGQNHDSRRLKEILGLPEAPAETVKRAFEEAGARAKHACPGLEVSPHTVGDSEVCGVRLCMGRTGEWSDVLQYAHGKPANEAIKVLSPPAAELLERIQSGELTEQFRSEASVRSRIRLFSYTPSFDDIFHEIHLKQGVEISVEEKGDKWKRREHLLKFSAKPAAAAVPLETPLNPVFDLSKDDLKNRRIFRRWFHRILMDAPFTGSDLRFIWRISTRAEFFRCFPGLASDTTIHAGPISGLVATLRDNGFFGIGWDWGDKSCEWTVSVRPKPTWEETKAKLGEEEKRPTAEAQFGLTSEAADLFDWVRTLEFRTLKFGLSPDIEKSLREDRLSLGGSWGENLRVVLDLLCEEITERTPYVLRVVEWTEQYSKGLRIRVRLKDRCGNRSFDRQV
jgi:hypothetical protein